MEEKLYFTPAKYGKGVKKRKEKTEKEDKDEKGHRVRNLVFFLLLLVTVILIILWLLHGKTTTSGQYPENVKKESLECNSVEAVYPKTDRVKPDSMETRIVMIFYGEDGLSSANFRYTMHFTSNRKATEAESIAHVQFAELLGYSGLSFEEFDNKFTIVDSSLTLSLYNSTKIKNDSVYEYFLIDKYRESDQYPSNLKEYRENYENQGFTCESSIDKK